MPAQYTNHEPASELFKVSFNSCFYLIRMMKKGF